MRTDYVDNTILWGPKADTTVILMQSRGYWTVNRIKQFFMNYLEQFREKQSVKSDTRSVTPRLIPPEEQEKLTISTEEG